MKFSGENVILRGIFHVVSRFPLQFMLYCGNLDYFSNRATFLPIRSVFDLRIWRIGKGIHVLHTFEKRTLEVKTERKLV